MGGHCSKDTTQCLADVAMEWERNVACDHSNIPFLGLELFSLMYFIEAIVKTDERTYNYAIAVL